VPFTNPPLQIDRVSYRTWLTAINSNISAFLDSAFEWQAEQSHKELPRQVNGDPDHIYVDVDRAEQETISLEASGDIEAGNGLGYDAYFLVDVPIAVALETALFYCGKPVGQDDGNTYPFNDVFKRCHYSFSREQGPGNYRSTIVMTGGGFFIQDIHDEYTFLLRGSASDGYVLYGSYRQPAGAKTATVAQISIAIFRATAASGTECRRSLRRNGQSYRLLGLDNGRKKYGFNAAKFYQDEKAFRDSMTELKRTGKIKENK
jgi:hypothetical protein